MAVGTLFLAAGNVLLLLFLSILLASALEPMVGSIRSRVGLGRGATILLVYASFFVVVLAFALIVVPGAISQAERIAASLPRSSRRREHGPPTSARARSATSLTALIDAAGGILAPAPPPNPDVVVKAGLTVAEVAVSIATVLAIVYFWLVEHARCSATSSPSSRSNGAPARATPGTRSRRASACGSAGSSSSWARWVPRRASPTRSSASRRRCSWP